MIYHVPCPTQGRPTRVMMQHCFVSRHALQALLHDSWGVRVARRMMLCLDAIEGPMTLLSFVGEGAPIVSVQKRPMYHMLEAPARIRPVIAHSVRRLSFQWA